MRSSLGAKVVGLGAAEIARRIAARELSARDAVDAHIARIEEVNSKLNAVVAPLFEQARQDAVAADERQARGEALSPLHGVPMTVKECYEVAGTSATMGLVTLKDNIAAADGEMIRRLRSSGAILLGKTNLPQLMLGHECDNPVYGLTKNPWRDDRTCGGSSGGEAAIIAAGGSPLGLANDMGGSIRVPAHFCGVHGLKPTNNRLPRSGSIPNQRGMEAIQYQPGLIARRVEDLAFGLAALCTSEPVTPYGGRPCEFDAPPSPLRDFRAVKVEGLRIAAWSDDGYFTAAPSVRRAVEIAAKALQDRGAIVEWIEPPDMHEGMRLYLGIMAADGGADARRLLAGGEVGWRIGRLTRIARLPRPARYLAGKALRTAGQEHFADLVETARAISADQFWRLTWQMRQFISAFLERMARGKFDVMLTPPHALPAIQHDKAIDLFAAASYTFLPNLLRVPVGVVACTRVREGEESDRPDSRDRVIRRAKEVERGSAGLPVGIQVAGWHWREDVVLAVMAALEESFCENDDYPRLV
jgi:fatty acid amide hydrolase